LAEILTNFAKGILNVATKIKSPHGQLRWCWVVPLRMCFCLKFQLS